MTHFHLRLFIEDQFVKYHWRVNMDYDDDFMFLNEGNDPGEEAQDAVGAPSNELRKVFIVTVRKYEGRI